MIATGSAPVDVKAWPRDGETIINSDDAVRLKPIPKQLLVDRRRRHRLGVRDRLHALGAQVLVVEMLPQILTGTDLEIGKTLGRILKKQGIEIMLNTKVGAIEKRGKSVSATLNGEGTGGKDETREFDMVLVAVGRRPVTDRSESAQRRTRRRRARLHRRRPAAAHEGTEHLRDRRRHRRAAARAPGDETRRRRGRSHRRRPFRGLRSGCRSELRLHRSEVATVGLSEEEAKAQATRCASESFRSLPADARAR